MEEEVHLPSKKPKNIKIKSNQREEVAFSWQEFIQGQEEEEKWILSCY